MEATKPEIIYLVREYAQSIVKHMDRCAHIEGSITVVDIKDISRKIDRIQTLWNIIKGA